MDMCHLTVVITDVLTRSVRRAHSTPPLFTTDLHRAHRSVDAGNALSGPREFLACGSWQSLVRMGHSLTKPP